MYYRNDQKEENIRKTPPLVEDELMAKQEEEEVFPPRADLDFLPSPPPLPEEDALFEFHFSIW